MYGAELVHAASYSRHLRPLLRMRLPFRIMFISSGPEAVCASMLFCTIVLMGCCFVLLCVSDASPCQADATLLEAPEIEADDSEDPLWWARVHQLPVRRR